RGRDGPDEPAAVQCPCRADRRLAAERGRGPRDGHETTRVAQDRGARRSGRGGRPSPRQARDGQRLSRHDGANRQRREQTAQREDADPGGPLSPTIARLTGLHDSDLVGAPSPAEAVAAFVAFARRNGEIPWVVGHNVGFDLAFLERHGFPADAPRLDTADLASILLPSAASYALQRLAADAAIVPDAAHRALDDALTSALVLGDLARRVRALPPLIVAELASFAPLLGDATGAFFADAASDVARNAWMQDASGEARGV